MISAAQGSTPTQGADYSPLPPVFKPYPPGSPGPKRLPMFSGSPTNPVKAT
ncbi:hypothetical protein H9Q10_01210 [Eikenella sp. S3360]|uniref:Uncharacterized protein n=1 Tax=Eikenella glucosivorans TaxID=2766967 RepID=A0ABS0N7P6_9NEIS|nr:hypothetical protein [Eikenella glucosivorans]MBH5328292.1 hypothetical protein [Eikenella glucosivorans]